LSLLVGIEEGQEPEAKLPSGLNPSLSSPLQSTPNQRTPSIPTVIHDPTLQPHSLIYLSFALPLAYAHRGCPAWSGQHRPPQAPSLRHPSRLRPSNRFHAASSPPLAPTMPCPLSTVTQLGRPSA
jgi:hypothetical protein